MADYRYHLQYRQKGTAPWTTATPVTADGLTTGVGRNATTKEMTFTIPAGVLTKGLTYEFRWVRLSGDGTATPLANSNAVEALVPETVPSVPDGGTLTTAGTFTASLDGNATTIVRSEAKLTLQLAANWEHVRIDLVSSLNGTTKYFAEKTSGFVNPAGYTEDAAVIAKTSSKTVDIKLNSTYTYLVTVKFNGNSTGTIQVNAI
jgi:hypothetical protein